MTSTGQACVARVTEVVAVANSAGCTSCQNRRPQRLRVPQHLREQNDLREQVLEVGVRSRAIKDPAKYANTISSRAKSGVLVSFELATEYARFYNAKVWFLLESPADRPFLISDNPVTMVNGSMHDDPQFGEFRRDRERRRGNLPAVVQASGVADVVPIAAGGDSRCVRSIGI